MSMEQRISIQLSADTTAFDKSAKRLSKKIKRMRRRLFYKRVFGIIKKSAKALFGNPLFVTILFLTVIKYLSNSYAESTMYISGIVLLRVTEISMRVNQ